jgi:VanZ family protein
MSLSPNAILVSRVVFIITVCLITYLAITQHHLPVFDDVRDPFRHTLVYYVLHMVAFYLLALLFDFAFPYKPPVVAKFTLLLGYGFGIEVFQGLFTERTFSLFDLLADMIGITLYVVSIPLLKHISWLRHRWDGEAPV